jgi:hypothetical protein
MENSYPYWGRNEEYLLHISDKENDKLSGILSKKILFGQGSKVVL